MIKTTKQLAWKIISEYISLTSIKNQDWFESKLSEWVEKSQLKKEEWDRYKTHLSRAIADQQKADLLHNNPIFDFIPLDRDARSNVYALKETWKYRWKIDETDSKIYDVVSDAADFGSWFLYQGWKVEYRDIDMPKFDRVKKWIIFENKKVEQYFWVHSEFIRIEDIYFDWLSIEDSNVAIWRKFWDRDDYIQAHENNSLYKNIDDKIPSYDIFMASNSKIPRTRNWDMENILVEIRYYNKSQDALVILANGKVVYNTPIPHLHKELPFVKYDNYIYRNRLVQMGNYELLADVEEYMDKVRHQTIDVTKANIWFTAIDKDSDFDPETYKIWTHEFIELENLDSIKHIASNIQANSLVWLQQSWQEDAIVLSWTDYRSQLLQSGETATKTASKNASQLKRVNLILKRNSFKFYNRLAKLRLADIQWISTLWEFKIPLKWLHVEWEDFIKLQDWYWLFTIKPKMLKWLFNITMQTESLLWDSTEKEKENYLNFFQVFWNVVDENQKPIMNRNNMITIAWQKLWVDVDFLLEKELASKSWEDIINETIQSLNWQGSVWNQSNNPNAIPVENRANNAGWVNVLGWWNTAIPS